MRAGIGSRLLLVLMAGTMLPGCGSDGNKTPEADAGADLTVARRSAVVLAGSGRDRDGDALRYHWRQVAGPAVELADFSSASASFVAPAEVASLEFTLTVNDGREDSIPDHVIVTVRNAPPQIASATIAPEHPRQSDEIILDVQASDPDQDPLVLGYTWTRNGTLITGAIGNSLDANLAQRGDVILATVTASDGTDTVNATVTFVIEDTPPVLNVISAPDDVNLGDAVLFQVVAQDDDGGPAGAFEVRWGPAGMQVDAAGNVTWQAGAPMFETTLDILWAVGLRDQPESIVMGSMRLHDPARRAPFRYGRTVIPAAREQMVVTDLDADGRSEILVGSGTMLAAWSESGGGYDQRWSYPFGLYGPVWNGPEHYGVTAIAAANVAGDANQEIFVASNGILRYLRGSDRQEADSTTLNCFELRVADLDQDGKAELVCLRMPQDRTLPPGPADIVVLRVGNGSFEPGWDAADVGTGFAIANVDADPALEVVTSGGRILDGRTHTDDDWGFPRGFGSLVEAADLDGDGVAEVLGLNPSGWIRVYSVLRHELVTEMFHFSSAGVSEMRLADVDGDARPDLLLGNKLVGQVTAYTYLPATQTFSMQSAAWVEGSTHSLAAGDLDADAAIEIVSTHGFVSDKPVLTVMDYAPSYLSPRWDSDQIPFVAGEFRGAMPARISAGERRVVSCAGSVLVSLEPDTGTAELLLNDARHWNWPCAVDVMDSDGDGVDEVMVASGADNPFVSAFDIASRTSGWIAEPGAVNPQALAHADFTADGSPDLVMLSRAGEIDVLDGRTGFLVWHSPVLDGGGRDVAAADLDGDGAAELLALTETSLHVFTRTVAGGAFVERDVIHGFVDAQALLVEDCDGDGSVEIHVANDPRQLLRTSSRIDVFDPVLRRVRTLELDVAVTHLIAEPLPGRKNLLVSGGRDFALDEPAVEEICARDALLGAEVWCVPVGGPVRDLNTVVEDDGAYEIAFASADGMTLTR